MNLTTQEGRTVLDAPYHPDFPKRARNLGGKWDGRTWTFDARDEERVRELCRAVYGTDGTAAAGDLVTVRLTVKDGCSEYRGGIFWSGRCLCRAYGRDSGAKLAEGVVLLSGSVGSGGSVKNWTTRIAPGTVLEVRDLPRAALEPNGENWSWEVVEETAPTDPDDDGSPAANLAAFSDADLIQALEARGYVIGSYADREG